MKKASIFVIAGLIAIASLYAFFAVRGGTQNKTEDQSAILSSSDLQDSGETLTSEEFDAELERLRGVLLAKDARYALETLREDMASSTRILNTCHELLHTLGHDSYRKDNDFGKALLYQDEMCSSGYIHGVLEAYFAAVPSVDAVLHVVCADTDAGSFKRSQCTHGIGHALMFYSSNNLPLSLTKCAMLKDARDVSACASGAYMENFNADQKVHLSSYLDPKRPLYPCTEQTMNLDGCYMYVPMYHLGLHPGDYQGALSICETVDIANRYYCYFGVGFQAQRRNLSDPLQAEVACSTSEKWRSACMDGVTYYYLGYTRSSSQTRALCDRFTSKNKKICLNAVQSIAGSFPDLQ